MAAVSAGTCSCSDPNYHKYTLMLGNDHTHTHTHAYGQTHTEMNVYAGH